MSSWTKSSWRSKKILQQPEYPSSISAAVDKISMLPPLVQSEEIERLRDYLAQVSRGERFLLQGGDCAERFLDCNMSAIDSKLKIILQMSLVLVWGAQTPVVRVGRIAGQYAKPRSNPTEKLADGSVVNVFKGDIINGFDAGSREPDPDRLVQAYFHSAATMNYIRGRVGNGFGDLHRAAGWDLEFVKNEQKKEEYSHILNELKHCLAFLSACGIESSSNNALSGVELFSSHEGMLLEYEEALTREAVSGIAGSPAFYNMSAHLLWIGDRTRQLDGAHVEYFRGIRNPIGVKLGPTTKPEEVIELIRTLNPDNEEGRIVLYSRLGAANVTKMLPTFIDAVRSSQVRNVVWAVDPMHGNTITLPDGRKTRRFDDVINEVIRTFEVHADMGSVCGGVHLEMTGEDVTECLGGAAELEEHNLGENYSTYCDPRLNYAQSMEIAFKVAQYLKKRKQHTRK